MQRHPSPSPQLSPPRAAWKMQLLGTEQFRLRLWDGPQLCSWACNALPHPTPTPGPEMGGGTSKRPLPLSPH